MTEIDDELLPAIAELATELGKDVTVTTQDLSGYDRTTGVATPVTVAFSRKLLGVGTVTEEMIGTGRVGPRGLAKVGDTTGLLAAQALGFTPDLHTLVAWGGVTYTTVAVQRLEPAGSVLAFRLVLRRA